jgi:hypothetical protein
LQDARGAGPLGRAGPPIEVISNELNYIGFPPPVEEADEAAA